jgi:eukaryotic-like serine/threonine-protein kinase
VVAARTRALGPGTLLAGRYRIEERIAAGGMAAVWRARDEELDRPVAVKVLSDTLADDESFVERFRREAKIAAALQHPNLVRVFDFSTDESRPYLVMECIPGPTLADRIDDGTASQLRPDRVASELLGALAHIHEAGVVHRDVKPSNVLLDEAERARLTDFGIAQPEDATRITQTGHVIGTARYMAPEVLEGEPATERSDLYSCGVVLREVTAGQASPQLAAVIDALTSPDPESRPASALDALAAVDAAGAPPATETASTVRAAGVRAAPAPLGPGEAPGPVREIRVTPARALIGLGAAGLAVLLAILLLGGGDSSHRTTAPANTGRAVSPPPSTAGTTSAQPTTPPPADTPPAPAPKAKPEPKPPKPPKDEKAPPGQVKKPEK